MGRFLVIASGIASDTCSVGMQLRERMRVEITDPTACMLVMRHQPLPTSRWLHACRGCN
jgi:hypothetical protein